MSDFTMDGEEKKLKQEHLKIQELMKHAGKFPLLTREQEQELIEKAHSKDPALKKEAETIILNHNFRIIIKIARKYLGRGLDLEDLIQEGADGLLHAVEKFDLSTKNKLSTYAVWWIHQKMGRAVANKSRLVRVSTNVLAEVTKLKKVYMEFIVEENCPPTPQQLSERLNWPVKKVEELGRVVYPHTSLDETSGEDELPLISYVLDDKTLPEDKIEQSLDREYVLNLLHTLTEEEQFFIKYKYGFLDDKFRKDKEMSTYLKISSKEVKAREESILKKLKDIADLSKINSDILCDVVITGFGKNPEKVLKLLKSWNKEIYLGSSTYVVFSSISQHLGQEYKKSLESCGAFVRLVSISQREG